MYKIASRMKPVKIEIADEEFHSIFDFAGWDYKLKDGVTEVEA